MRVHDLLQALKDVHPETLVVMFVDGNEYKPKGINQVGKNGNIIIDSDPDEAGPRERVLWSEDI